MLTAEQTDIWDNELALFYSALRKNGKSIRAAARQLAQLSPHNADLVFAKADMLIDQAALNTILTSTADPVTRLQAIEQAKESAWYEGPGEDPGSLWYGLRSRLSEALDEDTVESVDRSSTEVVSLMADPNMPTVRKKGLVVGYVQSGKTSNYAAVVAKAVDAGYRLVIILAGMHNNLRRQTQVRLDRDLDKHKWVQLTDSDADFTSQANTHSLVSTSSNKLIAVVKKNSHRLTHLRDWLEACGSSLKNCPILIIDDEADQATPNSPTKTNPQTAINKLVREIWELVPQGTYIGYTATPFANVFMDPDDEQELYPSDFIRSLPLSPDYFGAERLFGRQALDSEDEPDDGLNVARDVPEADTKALLVNAKDKEKWEASLPQSLEDAARWFLISTAIRRVRGQYKHSSMLVHFTHFVEPHFRMAEALRGWLKQEVKALKAGASDAHRTLWELEKGAVTNVGAPEMPTWDAIVPALVQTASETRVVVDNGQSQDRLDYDRTDAQGNPITETVIAIGGGTLSRGLTLEGLVVSYFIRTSSTYDTLLQMGRWFGYRPGYEDLPRIWMPQELVEDFRFLALVEADMRREIEIMASQLQSPKEIGLRIRSHPGRLEITAKAKMQNAEEVNLSFSGRMQQTFILHESDPDVLRGNLSALAKLISGIGGDLLVDQRPSGTADWLARDVPPKLVENFLAQHQVHDKQESLSRRRIELMQKWLREAAPRTRWNVAIFGTLDHPSVEHGLPLPMRYVNRAPLVTSQPGVANIKALISQPHRAADIQLHPSNPMPPPTDWASLRARHSPGEALLMLYLIDPESKPKAEPKPGIKASRRTMHAPMPLVGYGICFPKVENDHFTTSASYMAVAPTWERDPDAEEVVDLEGDAGQEF